MSEGQDVDLRDAADSDLGQRIAIKQKNAEGIVRNVGAYLDPNQKEKVSENKGSVI